MALTHDDVQKVAYLSRLFLSDQEIAKFQAQLSNILGYIEELNELDTSNVEPTISMSGNLDTMREDATAPSLTQADALKNAENPHNGYFVVPYVFE